MQILNAQQIRDWDLFTMENEPIASIDLMERAALACTDWLMEHILSNTNKTIDIFCGKGNNGGDGLAIARMLTQRGFSVIVHILEFGHLGTDDFQLNLQRIHETPVEVRFISSRENFPELKEDGILIDALFGSGLNRPLEGLTAELVQYINEQSLLKIAIDIPSGLFLDSSVNNNPVIKADHTLSFQCMKLAFLLPENQDYTGRVSILDIKLHKDFLKKTHSPFQLVDDELVRSIYRPRKPFSHKGTFGHALIVAGSYGKMGAAVLATKACLRTGAGLTTVRIPSCGYDIIQSVCPEAMALPDESEKTIGSLPVEIEKFQSIAIGPGIGTAEITRKMVAELLGNYHGKLVMDADALNSISGDMDQLRSFKGNAILTPHPKEFQRLFGETTNDYDRLELCRRKAKEYNVVIILKGKYSAIVTPGGMVFFNSTGNAGMAKGGTGDVLTGMLGALLAQGYEPEFAAITGCYLHGLAGDLSAMDFSEEAMLSTDLVERIGLAYQQLM
jgi:ADP-dependent NAD(P)H-hydrate dehydratase / NAD(P)H-hydrate epimerase